MHSREFEKYIAAQTKAIEPMRDQALVASGIECAQYRVYNCYTADVATLKDTTATVNSQHAGMWYRALEEGTEHEIPGRSRGEIGIDRAAAYRIIPSDCIEHDTAAVAVALPVHQRVQVGSTGLSDRSALTVGTSIILLSLPTQGTAVPQRY